MLIFFVLQRQKLEQCVEFETRKLQELQTTFESDWIEFRNNQKTRKMVSKFLEIFSSIQYKNHDFYFANISLSIYLSVSSRLISSIFNHLVKKRVRIMKIILNIQRIIRIVRDLSSMLMRYHLKRCSIRIFVR